MWKVELKFGASATAVMVWNIHGDAGFNNSAVVTENVL